MQLFRNRVLLLIFDTIVFLLCVAGVEQSRQKADLHARVTTSHMAMDSVIVESTTPDERVLQTGDVLLGIAGYDIGQLGDVEQILDGLEVDSTVTVRFRRGSETLEASYTLTAFYSLFDLIMQSGGILIFFALGFFVLSRRPAAVEAQIFHQLAITVAGVIAFTPGYFLMEPVGTGHLLRALLPSVYAFLGTLLLHFGFVFPVNRNLRPVHVLVVHLPAIVLSIAGAYTSYRATVPVTLSLAPAFYDVLSMSKMLMVLGAAAGIGVMLHTFRRTRDSIMRKQIAWVVLGVGFSIVVYVVAWQLAYSPYLRALFPVSVSRLIESARISESLLILSLVLTASFIAIGIIRYRFFDIEFFFRRGTVGAIVYVLLMLLYLTIVVGGQAVWGRIDGDGLIALSLLALLICLLLFRPLSSLVQRGVDRWFFRLEYDFRESLTKVSKEIADSVVAAEVADAMVRGLDDLLHLHGVMVFSAREDGQLTVLAKRGFPRWRAPGLHLHPRRLKELPHHPMVLSDVMENGTDVVEMRMPFAERFGVVMIRTLRSEDGDTIGLLALGDKRSGTRFTHEDMDLLHSLGTQAGLQLERLRLQERILLQQQEAEKLRELSQMKSYFVSGVSHDLKTPLTSIKLFAELLEQLIPEEDEGAQKYVGIIQGECDRLGRLINNVLDFTKIERGMMKYNFTRVDVNDVLRRSHDVMHYQFVMGGFSCDLSCTDTPLYVSADADALLEAVTNLLSNAMKYSGTGREIVLRARREGDQVCIDVEDRGLGIAAEDQAHLFEPFYRSRDGNVQKHGGVGLGLSLVKHIVDAHQGGIGVRSTLGEGSVFTITLHISEAA